MHLAELSLLRCYAVLVGRRPHRQEMKSNWHGPAESKVALGRLSSSTVPSISHTHFPVMTGYRSMSISLSIAVHVHAQCCYYCILPRMTLFSQPSTAPIPLRNPTLPALPSTSLSLPTSKSAGTSVSSLQPTYPSIHHNVTSLSVFPLLTKETKGRRER